MTAEEKRLIAAVSALFLLGGAVRWAGVRSRIDGAGSEPARRASDAAPAECAPADSGRAPDGADESADPGSEESPAPRADKKAAAPAGPIDVNTGDASSLERLPGIGPTKARAIIEWRAAHGPFRSLADLEKVPGIGPKTIARIAPLLTLGSPSGRMREENDEPRSRRSSLPGRGAEPGPVPARPEAEGVVGRPDG
ncbi:MAG: helix-hairpin-helix domain-containing protein [Candidatus Latescibacterota bacterium]|nr:MAG: helix-hairpin-helix domain-containing protein [Candidatus Latescibacterota bacterium]